MTTSELKQYVIAESVRIMKVEILKEEKAKIIGKLKRLDENYDKESNDRQYEPDVESNRLMKIYADKIFSSLTDKRQMDKSISGGDEEIYIPFTPDNAWEEYALNKMKKNGLVNYDSYDDAFGSIYWLTKKGFESIKSASDIIPYFSIYGPKEEVIMNSYVEQYNKFKPGHSFVPNDDDRDDDGSDSGMSSTQQAFNDRLDYAREKKEKGDWDETQADEFRRGA